jgi:predicted GIY-YIG superfamily endonuclease
MRYIKYNHPMWYIYVLLCQDESLYTGISPDPQKRFQDHCSGKGSRYTRSHKPIKIVYLKKQKNKSQALKRELEIKSWVREEKISKLKLEI